MNILNFKFFKYTSHNFIDRAILFSVLLFMMNPAKDAIENKDMLRVMSFNIAAGHGNIDEIVNVIREYDPDIVALQEVDVHWGARSDFKDQARYLGETLNMHHFFGEIYTLEPEEEQAPPRQYGLGYLSKEPLTHQHNHLLTRLSTQTPEPELKILPGFPEIVVEIKGHQIHIFNTHLDYRRDPVVRQAQVEEMIEIMKDADGPVILMGDLNARPGAEELSPLFEMLKDTWGIKDDPGYTFPADQPDRRIDYILHSDHFKVSDIFVAKTEASDHRPVVADIYFK